MSLHKKITAWEQAGLLSAAQSQAIAAYEAQQPSVAAFMWRYGLFGLGILTIMIGLVAIIAANWGFIPSELKLLTHCAINAGVAALLLSWWQKNQSLAWRFEGVLLIKTILVLTLMALLGQILQTQSPFEKTMLVWWTLITPMLFFLGRYRASFLLWITLSLTVFFTNTHFNEATGYGCLMAIAQIFLLLPLFSLWQNQKPGWSDLGKSLGLISMIIGINLLFFDHPRPGPRIYVEPFSVMPFYTRYAWEIAVAANMILAAVILFVKYRTLSLRRVWQTTTPLTRTLLVHLVLALIVPNLPEWFGWFILYWFYIGYLGLRRDDRRIVGGAVVVMALRIIAVYFDLTEDLMGTGLIMIGSGIVVIYLVKTYNRWRTALLGKTA
jgi:uncharacterized membrane protein